MQVPGSPDSPDHHPTLRQNIQIQYTSFLSQNTKHLHPDIKAGREGTQLIELRIHRAEGQLLRGDLGSLSLTQWCLQSWSKITFCETTGSPWLSTSPSHCEQLLTTNRCFFITVLPAARSTQFSPMTVAQATPPGRTPSPTHHHRHYWIYGPSCHDSQLFCHPTGHCWCSIWDWMIWEERDKRTLVELGFHAVQLYLMFITYNFTIKKIITQGFSFPMSHKGKEEKRCLCMCVSE